MPDNVTTQTTALSTPPDATVIATDQLVGGEHVQKIKILDGTADGSAGIPGDAGNGLDVDVTRVSGNVTVVQSTATNLKVDASGVAVPVTDNGTTLSVDDGAGSLTVDGTVGVSGTVTVDSELTTADLDTGVGTDTRAVVGLVGSKSGGGALIPGDATTGLKVDLGADNDVVVSDGGNVISVDDAAGSLTVDNSTLAVVGGGTEATAMRVTVASDSTGVLSVDDNGTTLSVDDAAGSLTVDNGGTFVVQENGSALTALQLIDDTIFADDVAFTVASSKVSAIGALADETSTDSVDEGDIGIPRMTLDRKLRATQTPHTAGGLSVHHLVSAATTNATVVKASAGQVFGWYFYNSNAAARKVAFHNASTTPTAGASIFFTIVIPPTSAANVEFTNGIEFTTGIAITMVTGLADSDATAVAANDLISNIFYK